MTIIEQIQQLAGVPVDGTWGPETDTAVTRQIANLAFAKALQGILCVPQDGQWGPVSSAALRAIINPASRVHQVQASSFADPKDVAAFRACKALGGTDQECFKVGDNAVGAWGEDTSEGSGPSCALPPEDMIETWGSISAAHLKPVLIEANGKSAVALVKDRMPHRAAITNGAGIDCNPDTVRALGLEPPMMVSATWQPA